MKHLLLFICCAFSFLKINAQENQNRKTANIASFAKVYGYVRYFHPSDEAANLNWEEFVYYGIKDVENAGSTEILTKKLNALFNPIAPSVLITPVDKTNNFSLETIMPSDRSLRKEISWQHYGLGTGPGLYRSIRTNRPSIIPDAKTSGFGNVTNVIDAKLYVGKRFRLKASIKAEVNQGQAQMWLRVDKENNKMGFFDNMDARPIKKNEWSTYQITGTVDSGAVKIVFGTFLRGLGKMWVDNYSLEVEDHGKWTKIPFNNPSFEESTDKAVKGWFSQSPGYNYQIVTENVAEGKNALLITDNSMSKMESQLFDAKAKFGEYFTRKIGNGLSIVVPLVLMGSESATYPAANVNQLKALQNKIKASVPEKMNVEDVYVRLSGIVVAWNVFQHFYPYQDEINMDWANQLPNTLTAAYQVKSVQDYARLLGLFTEKLKDGHVYISNPGILDYFSIPAAAAFVEGRLIVQEVDSANNTPEQTTLKKGDIITFIDGQPALEKLEALKKVISGSPQWKNTIALSKIFNGLKNSEIILKVKRGNAEEREVRLLRANFRNVKDKVTIKKLDNNIYYLNVGTTEMKEINARLPELLAAKGIICDLRGYPRNNNDFINYLLTVNDTNKWMFVPQIIYPDYEKVGYESMGWDMKPAKPHLNAKIIFLTGGGAVSYAESYMGFIKHYKLATIVGQPTAGANGNVTSFMLPGGFSIRFTGMKVKQQDGSRLQGIGIQPDVFVEQTIKGITEGRDEYLEKALELLK